MKEGGRLSFIQEKMNDGEITAEAKEMLKYNGEIIIEAKDIHHGGAPYHTFHWRNSSQFIE